jgi:anaerobic selenocysteine-containing dehydrogenase
MFDLMAGGAIKMIWISATNPAVSFVNLEKMRRILGMPGLFVIAQDIFETETTQLADVVLPAAMWGEKTGCFTNVGEWTVPQVMYLIFQRLSLICNSTTQTELPISVTRLLSRLVLLR